MGFSYTIAAHVCEGVGDCVEACPVECIAWVEGRVNDKGTKYPFIDGAECINCCACLAACPVEGAVLDDWQPHLQAVPQFDHVYSKFRPAWRTAAVRAAAEALRGEVGRARAVALADALIAAGCSDMRLIHHLRSDPPAEVAWVADLVLCP